MKKTLLILSILAVIFPVNLFAQTTGWQWARANSGGGSDGWPVAVDPSGNVFMGVLGFSSPMSFGSYNLPFPTGAGTQAVVVKYDPSGNFQWATGTEFGSAYIINIAADNSGNVLMLASLISDSIKIGSFVLYNAPGASYYKYMLVKFDAAGNVLWAHADGGTTALGGSGGYVPCLSSGAITTDASDNCYITTSYNVPSISVGTQTFSNSDLVNSSFDIIMVKYTPSGAITWAKSVGGVGDDVSTGIAVTPAGEIYISGNFNTPSTIYGTSTLSAPTYSAAFIARFNSSGTALWACSSGNSSNDLIFGNACATGIAADPSNNIYMTGGIRDNNVSFNGTAIPHPNPGVSALFLVKFDPSNNVVWSRTIGGSGETYGFCIANSNCANVWVSGNMYSDVTIDGHLLTVPPNSCDPIFICGYTSSGSVIGYSALQSGGDDQNGIACDAFGNVYMCSDCACTPFTVNQDNFTSVSSEYTYVAKYHAFDTGSSTVTGNIVTNACMLLNINAPSGYSGYLWNDGNTNSTRQFGNAGTYWVTCNGWCGSGSLIDTFIVKNCSCVVSFPNAFTPNGDGYNDGYKPIFSPECEYSDYSFSIYNRWGELVFKSENNDERWDGIYLGQLCEIGTYMYQCSFKNNNTGEKSLLTGDITLVR